MDRPLTGAYCDANQFDGRSYPLKHFEMMRLFGLLACAFISLTQIGCATMFSGTKERVRITSNPERATVIVFSGPLASALKYGVKASQIVAMIGDGLSPADRKFLEGINVESLITLIVLEFRGGRPVTDSTSAKVAEVLAKVPRELKAVVLDKVGLKEFAVAPVDTELPRGMGYAVIGWHPPNQAKVEILESRFNWTTLWNVLNLGIGIPVDIYTGAWRKFNSSQVDLKLSKFEASH